MTLRAAAILLAALAGGCASTTAIIDGKTVPRLELAFTGQPYIVRHHRAHPRPGGPSSGLTDSGGDIVGRVCGVDVDFEVQHEGDHVQLTGFIDNERASVVRVADREGARTFTGGFGGHSIDLKLFGDHIEGHVGLRVIFARMEGDTFTGFMRLPGWTGALPVRISGRGALFDIPAADQAVILPLLVTCYFGAAEQGLVRRLEIGIGGPTTEVPHNSSSLYTAGPGVNLRGGRAR